MGRKAAFLILSMALAAAPVGVARAQNEPPPPERPTGSSRSGMSTTMRAENIDALRELSAFGVCFARFHRNDALAFLGTPPGSPEEAAFFDRAIGGERADCYVGGSWTNASLIYWRGVIAEGLLVSRQPAPDNLRLAAPTVDQVRDLHDVARCYVSGHRTEAQTVLAARPGSREETAAISAIWSDVRACFPPGLNARLNAPWVRFLLAEALLRTAGTASAQAGN
jgi:hypothetical protein